MPRALVLATVALLLGGAFAGCLKSATPGANEPVTRNDQSTPPMPIASTPAKKPSQEEVNQSLGQRWHFHNYWGLSPNLTLFDGLVTLDPQSSPEVSVLPSRAVLGSATFSLPQGRIVPPETGVITAALWFNGTPVLTKINVSYKPANTASFLPAGAASAGKSVAISVTPDMTDVPHRGRSIWQFRLTAAPSDQGFGIAANQSVHVKLVATIGRPIFIDPPHLDHWRGATTLQVLSRARDVDAAKTPLPDPAYVQVGGVNPANPAPSAQRGNTLADFPLVNGSVVPEGAHTVLVRLTWTWTTSADPKPLSLAYSEENSGTSGALQPVSDKPGERLYKLSVTPRMTDSPYANQSTWTFRVLADDAAGGFAGTVKIEAWAAQAASDVATFPGAPAPKHASASGASGAVAPVSLPSLPLR